MSVKTPLVSVVLPRTLLFLHVSNTPAVLAKPVPLRWTLLLLARTVACAVADWMPAPPLLVIEQLSTLRNVPIVP